MVQRSNMPMIKRCCFSRNLRAGAIACGIWTLVSLASCEYSLQYFGTVFCLNWVEFKMNLLIYDNAKIG